MLPRALVLLFFVTLGDGLPPLGSLSEKYESGGRGPATISTGKGDPGGVSYGTYQLSSKVGRADAFVKKYYPQEFKDLKAGTPEFSKRWKELADREPEKLRANEHEYIKATHYDPQVNKLAKSVGLVVDKRSRAVQNAIWSTAVQHGPNTKIVETALTPLLKDRKIEAIDDETLLRAVYAERGRKDDQGVMVHFKAASEAVQKSVSRRFQNELKDALAALALEKRAK